MNRHLLTTTEYSIGAWSLSTKSYKVTIQLIVSSITGKLEKGVPSQIIGLDDIGESWRPPFRGATLGASVVQSSLRKGSISRSFPSGHLHGKSRSHLMIFCL